MIVAYMTFTTGLSSGVVIQHVSHDVNICWLRFRNENPFQLIVKRVCFFSCSSAVNMCDNTGKVDALETTNSADHRDINDIFDDIVLSEERINEEAYEKGLLEGKVSGNTDGYHLGYHRGAELGAELGFYYGTLDEYRRSTSVNDRQKVTIEKVLDLINQFPRTNDEHVDIIGLADNIRAQYRKACAILKINGKFPESDQLNF